MHHRSKLSCRQHHGKETDGPRVRLRRRQHLRKMKEDKSFKRKRIKKGANIQESGGSHREVIEAGRWVHGG